MTDWEADVEGCLQEFLREERGNSRSISRGDIEVEFLEAPHQPAPLPAGKMAAMGFWRDGHWLLIGMAGSKSNARFQSQHYNARSSRSNLAKFLLEDPEMTSLAGLDPESVREWIKTSTNRVNIFMPATEGVENLAKLKACLHDC